MHYDLKRPCANCPFLKEGGVRLHPKRAEEIAEGMLSPQGHTFACHKTTVCQEHDDGSSDMVETPKSRHCAGALIFAEKNGNATQMMRIAERIGWYDAKSLMSDQKVVASVFDDLEQMVEAQQAPAIKRRKKK